MGLFDGLLGKRRKSGGPTCVACDSGDLVQLAPGAYRCSQCGYEGGPGFAAYQAQKQVAALQALPALQLQRNAREQLARVRSLISSIEPSTETIATRKSGPQQIAEAGEGVMEATETVAEAFGAIGELGVLSDEVGMALQSSRNKRFALMEIRDAVTGLRQILYAWTTKPGYGATVPQALAASDSLLVDSIRNAGQKQGLVQVVDHIAGLVDKGTLGP